MFFLIPLSSSDGPTIWCKPGITNAIIGRKSSKTHISSDDKISRSHGLISVSSFLTVTITDTSLLGISVDGVRIAKGVPTEIREKQTVLFYSIGYKLVRKDYTLCFSSSSGKEKEVSMRYAREAGVEVSRDWTAGCSHLVQGEYTTTAKVIRAMLQFSHEWVKAVARADPYKYIHPEEAHYKPAFSEEFQKQVDYSPLASRKSLLAQKTFIVFSAAQLSHLSGLIPLAGGFVEHYEGFGSLRTVDGRNAAVKGLETYLDGFEYPCMVKLRGVGDDTPIAQVILQAVKRYFVGNLSGRLKMRLLDEDDIGTCILLVDKEFIDPFRASPKRIDHGQVSIVHSGTYFTADSQMEIEPSDTSRVVATEVKPFGFVDSQAMDGIGKAPVGLFVEEDSPAESVRQPAKFTMPPPVKALVKPTAPPVKAYKPPPPVVYKGGKKDSQSQGASSMAASVISNLFNDSSDEDSPPAPAPVFKPVPVQKVVESIVENAVDDDGFITAAPRVKSTLKRAGTAVPGPAAKRTRTCLAESGLIIEAAVGADGVKEEKKEGVKERTDLPLEEQSNQQFLDEMHRMRREGEKDDKPVKEEKKKPKKKSKKRMEADRPKASRFSPTTGDVSDLEEEFESDAEEDIEKMKGLGVVAFAKLVYDVKKVDDDVEGGRTGVKNFKNKTGKNANDPASTAPPDLPREFITMKTYVKDEMIVGELGDDFEPWLKQKRTKDEKKYKKTVSKVKQRRKEKRGDVVGKEVFLYSSGPSDASSVEDGGGVDGGVQSMDEDVVEIDMESENEEELMEVRKPAVRKKLRKYDLVLDEESEEMDF